MNDLVLFIDFEDSFSLNIVSELYLLNIHVKRILFSDFMTASVEEVESYTNFKNIILGPGPGHPDEYFKYLKFSNFLNRYLASPSSFLLGICLGHQIIGCHLGFKVIESSNKRHGESVQYQVKFKDQCFPKHFVGETLSLQRYNSLTLDRSELILDSSIFIGLDDLNEIACMRGNNFLTYQFHPESVGTKYREEIFSYIANSLYNC